jgi:probable addiction module antidote protein
MTKQAIHKAPKLTEFDVAEYLDSPEVAIEYLNQAFATGEPGLITAAIGDVARARGMSGIAKTAKLGRQSLYKALDKGGNPSVDTLVRVMSALGLKLTAEEA